NVRPVAAPYGTMANRLDNCASQRTHFRVVAILGDAIRAGELHPAGAARDSFDQLVEVCARQTIAFQHVAHMIDDEIDLDLRQIGDEVTDDAAGRVELQVPTERLCLADAAFDVRDDIR